MSSSEDQLDPHIQEQEFIIHKGNKRPVKGLPDTSRADYLVEKCWTRHSDILARQKERFCKNLLQCINDNVGEDKTQNENSQSQEKGKKKKEEEKEKEPQFQSTMKRPQKIIIPIQVKKNQESYVNEFMTYLTAFVQKNLQPSSDSSQNDGQVSTKKYFAFNKMRKINIIDNQKCDNICAIALNLRKKIQRFEVGQDYTVYISSTVVKDLRPQKLYVIEDGLPTSKCCIIAPTFSSFELETFNKYASLEIIPFKLFDHKQLFQRLFYKCLFDEQIKAYLPKQSLKLLDQFDDFPITFVEGTARLASCIHRLQMLRQQRKKDFKHVEIKQLIQTLQDGINRGFKVFKQDNFVSAISIKCILDENQSYPLLQKFLSKLNWFVKEQSQKGKDISESDLVQKIRDTILKKIQENPNIAGYAKYLKEAEKPAKKTTSKKDKQLDRYQIDRNVQVSESILLQQQIKSLITSVTNQVRKQANLFKWQDFNYENQNKPMIPYNVFTAVNRCSPMHKRILDFIYQRISTALSRIIYKFCVEENHDYGMLMYHIKDLEQYGIIHVSSHALNPMVTPNFFEKSVYTTRKIC